MTIFTPRPEPTPLTRETVRFQRTSEFANLDTEVGRQVATLFEKETAA